MALRLAGKRAEVHPDDVVAFLYPLAGGGRGLRGLQLASRVFDSPEKSAE